MTFDFVVRHVGISYFREKRMTNRQTNKAQGFTLIELLVVIAIIAILASILFPVFARARENARRSSCQSNLKQLALGVMQYTQDYDERMHPIFTFPAVGSTTLPNGQVNNSGIQPWVVAIYPYVKSAQIFNCPSMSDGTYRGGAAYEDANGNPSNRVASYGQNDELGQYNTGLAIAQIPETAITPLLADNVNMDMTPNLGSVVEPHAPVARHLETFNIAFVDGHVKAVKLDAWTLSADFTCTNAIYRKWKPSCQ
jgi:prepilin-type N-terminal cleavage/methylation domain-containing protein/prepilin-type processing-associated H-X9-DG protein